MRIFMVSNGGSGYFGSLRGDPLTAACRRASGLEVMLCAGVSVPFLQDLHGCNEVGQALGRENGSGDLRPTVDLERSIEEAIIVRLIS